MNKNEIATAKTREQIIEIAREKFRTNGYFNTSLQEIAEEIELTRGALYHNFSNKKDIFIEVIKIIQSEIADYIEKRAEGFVDPWEQLVIGCVAFVQKAVDKDIVRILLIDGPSVISWKLWKNLDSQNSEFHLKDQLVYLKKNNKIKNLDIDYLTSYISGGLNELAMNISYQDDHAVDEVESFVRDILEGIRNYG